MEAPKSYLESFQTLVFNYRKIVPPDQITRIIAYRMLKQKLVLLKVVELNGKVYIITIKNGNFVVFEISPLSWKFRTLRDKRIPLEVLRIGFDALVEMIKQHN